MAETLKTVFDRCCKSVRVDRSFVKELGRYHNSLINRDADSMAFFGDALLGVYPIHFTMEDNNRWFDDVLAIDDIELRRDVHALPSIDPTFKVTSNHFNLSTIYIAYRCLTSSSLSQRDREQGAAYCFNILHCKFLSSLQKHRFPYRADKSVALATYASLSKKFAIKVHGSWKGLLDARAENIMSKRSIHYSALTRFNDDDEITYVVCDIQSRIREVVNKLTEEFHKVRDQDAGIGTASKLISTEDGNVLMDSVNKQAAYKQYFYTTLPDRRSLIREELVSLIGRAMSRAPEEQIVEALTWLSDNYRPDTGNNSKSSRVENRIGPMVEDVLVHAFDVMHEQKLKPNQLAVIVTKLRTLYLASRTVDERLIGAKENCLKMVERSISSRNPNVHVSVRAAVMLYIVLRTLTKDHYK